VIELDAKGCAISEEMARKIRWQMSRAEIEPDLVKCCFEQKMQIENLSLEVTSTYITKEMLEEAERTKRFPHNFTGVRAEFSADNPRDEIQFFVKGEMVARITNLARPRI
jgi:hypothetical protein